MRRSVLAALFGAAACYGVLAVTEPPGPGLDPDSMSYLGAAESLVRHGTLRIPAGHWADPDSTSPLGHFPPGFSLAIAVPAALGAPPEQAARGTNALAAGATVAIAVWLTCAAAGLGAGALLGTALIVNPNLALNHLSLLSEPLSLALLAATLALMVHSRQPLSYGIAGAAAGLVRYAAISFAGAAALWAFGQHGSVRNRLRRVALAALPAMVLEGAWALYTRAGLGGLHTVGWQGGLGPSIRQLGQTLAGWAAPSVPNVPTQASLAVAFGAGAVTVVVLAARPAASADREVSHAPISRLLVAAALLAGCYATELLLSRLLLDRRIPFDERLLAPLFLLAEIALVAAVASQWRRWSRRSRAVTALVGALWLGGCALATANLARDVSESGWDYDQWQWRNSALGEWLRGQGSDERIFSNNWTAVYFFTHRPSRDLPADLGPRTLARFAHVLRSGPGVVVRFPFDWEPVASPDSIAARLGLRRLASFPDGVVWGAPREQSLPGDPKRD